MNTLVKPFSALRPKTEHASTLIAPPYDVVNEEEVRALISENPNSFLCVSRPETEFSPGTNPNSEAIHAKAKENLERLKSHGLLVREDAPAYYVYKMKMGSHEQTGIALTASVDAYNNNIVKKHELTRPTKEDDRTRNMLSLNAQTGPVLSVYRNNKPLKNLLSDIKKNTPLFEVKGQYEVIHTIWRIEDAMTINMITSIFEEMQNIYIADGHHRSAAAARVSNELRTSNTSSRESFDYFLTVVFPQDEMQIFDYNRVIRDLNGLSPTQVLNLLSKDFNIEATDKPIKPNEPGMFGMFLANQWYRLILNAHLLPTDNPVALLDVSLLQDRILSPVLNVGDPRTDPRLDFVGGVRGLKELENLVRSGKYLAAFSLYPTTMEQLMAVADAGEIMPPKSTWFEPKLGDGLLSHVLD